MKLVEIYDSSPEYQNYKVRQITANQNRLNDVSRNASHNATMAAHKNHTAPIYATQAEWDNWMRMGGIEFARQMDLDRMNDPRAKQFRSDADDRQNYIRSRLQQGMKEAYDPKDPDSWMDPTNRRNAEYAQTHYSQPADDTLTTDGTFSDSAAYANHASRTNTAQQNRERFAAQNARYKANLAANSQHTSPMYSTPEEWNMWVKQGGLDYAREMDISNLRKQQKAKHDVDYAERQAYIKSLEQKQRQRQSAQPGEFSGMFRQHFQQQAARRPR